MFVNENKFFNFIKSRVKIIFCILFFSIFNFNGNVGHAVYTDTVVMPAKNSHFELKKKFNNILLETDNLLIRDVGFDLKDCHYLAEAMIGLSDEQFRFLYPYESMDNLSKYKTYAFALYEITNLNNNSDGSYVILKKPSDAKALGENQKLERVGHVSVAYLDDFNQFNCCDNVNLKNIRKRVASVGIFIVSGYQLKGYGTEALEAIVKELLTFEELDYVVVECCMSNIASKKMIEKVASSVENSKLYDLIIAENLCLKDFTDRVFACVFKKK